MKKTPNWRPKWADQGQREPTSDGGTRQRWDTLRTCEPGGDPTGGLAARAAAMTSPQNERHRVRREGRAGRRGDTKRRWQPVDKDLARSRYKRRALTGHSRRSESRPATKSAKDVTKKERGMERVSDSDLATNCGM